MAEVYLNSRYLGTVDDAALFASELKDLRRKGKLSEQVNVRYDEATQEVQVFTEGSRAQRPLIVVKEGRSLVTEKHIEQLTKGELSWFDLVRQGVIEYLDAAEEENALVASTEEELTAEHRSEEHTSELQSQFHLVCRLFLYKNKSKLFVGQSTKSLSASLFNPLSFINI